MPKLLVIMAMCKRIYAYSPRTSATRVAIPFGLRLLSVFVSAIPFGLRVLDVVASTDLQCGQCSCANIWFLYQSRCAIIWTLCPAAQNRLSNGGCCSAKGSWSIHGSHALLYIKMANVWIQMNNTECTARKSTAERWILKREEVGMGGSKFTWMRSVDSFWVFVLNVCSAPFTGLLFQCFGVFNNRFWGSQRKSFLDVFVCKTKQTNCFVQHHRFLHTITTFWLDFEGLGHLESFRKQEQQHLGNHIFWIEREGSQISFFMISSAFFWISVGALKRSQKVVQLISVFFLVPVAPPGPLWDHCLYVYMLICLYVYMFICLYGYMFIICLSVYMSIC